MSTILIATDFSKASRNASIYGVHLARAMNAKIILFTAWQDADQTADLIVGDSHIEAKLQVQRQLEDEAAAITEDVSELEIIVEAGTPQELISAVSLEKKVDMIVIGLTGSGGGLSKIFGSTTGALLNNLTIPVMVVPADCRFNSPKNILYASDIFLDVKIPAIDQVQWLTNFFGSTLFVVRVVKDGFQEVREQVNTPQFLREELRLMKTSFSFPVNVNATTGLTEFMRKQKIDMVIMLPRKHQWKEHFFVETESMDMAFHSHVPLLMLPHQNTKNVLNTKLKAIETF